MNQTQSISAVGQLNASTLTARAEKLEGLAAQFVSGVTGDDPADCWRVILSVPPPDDDEVIFFNQQAVTLFVAGVVVGLRRMKQLVAENEEWRPEGRSDD